MGQALRIQVYHDRLRELRPRGGCEGLLRLHRPLRRRADAERGAHRRGGGHMRHWRGSRRLVFLGSPYRHPDPFVMAIRAKRAAQIAAGLVAHGYYVYAPIVYGHNVWKQMPVGFDANSPYWHEHCIMMLERSDSYWVATIEGWRESRGIHE